MSKSSVSALTLFALTLIHRPDPKVEKEDGKPVPVEAIQPGRVFEAVDEKSADELVRLGGARPATAEEVAAEEVRREREGEDASVSTIIASASPGGEKAQVKGTGGKAAGSGSKQKAASPDPLI